MPTVILGISAFYHDSAAAILVDGKLIAAAQEERFTRQKHDPGFPTHAIRYVLEAAGVSYEQLSAIAFYEKPLLKFERLLETFHAFVPRGLPGFVKAMPVWIKEKLFMRRLLRRSLAEFGAKHPPFLFPEHHLSHAASAFYPSPFDEAAILTVDGVGEWATTTISHGRDGKIELLKEGLFPHSLGLLYSAFTYYLGFRVNSGEYKLMGLAAYGNPNGAQTIAFREKITTQLVDIREDGSILLNMRFFQFATGLRMIRHRRWTALFGFPRRLPESAIRQEHMDLALAIQQVTESILLALADTARRLTGCPRLVMAGGVALNCVANARLAAAAIFDDIWIQPAAGDAGGALGAAYAAWHLVFYPNADAPTPQPANSANPTPPAANPALHIAHPPSDQMQGALLGPSFSYDDIRQTIRRHNAAFRYFSDFDALAAFVAKWLAAGKVIGWFQHRMEFGPRALGNRSILADPGNPDMQKRLNEKVKFREGFRPFAPAILEEDLSLYFKTATPSPYMLTVAEILEIHRHPEPPGYHDLGLYERLYHLRSILPAITHLDYTARVQTVNSTQNPKFVQLLREFKKLTGYGILVNTSFNVRGEPIVCTPDDAWLGFCRTNMDGLVIGNFFFDRSSIPSLPITGNAAYARPQTSARSH